MKSVSYTHLDVYKRQLLVCVNVQCTAARLEVWIVTPVSQSTGQFQELPIKHSTFSKLLPGTSCKSAEVTLPVWSIDGSPPICGE